MTTAHNKTNPLPGKMGGEGGSQDTKTFETYATDAIYKN